MEIHKEEYKGYIIRIKQDEDAEGPREWDNLGTMVCFHSRYNLGDDHDYRDAEDMWKNLAMMVDPTVEDRINWWEDERWDFLGATYDERAKICDERVKAIISKALDKGIIWLPLYLYDHSGITMSTGAFSCSWDSGMVGIIYVTLEDVRKEWGKKRVSKKLRERIAECLKGEVETYDHFITNNVWGFIIDGPVEPGESEETRDEHIDSCWGFLGDYDNEEHSALTEARSVVDSIIEEQEKEEAAFQAEIAPFVTPAGLSLTSAAL